MSHVDRLVCFQTSTRPAPVCAHMLTHLCMDVCESFFSLFFSYFSVCILPMHAYAWQCLSMPPPICAWFPMLTPADLHTPACPCILPCIHLPACTLHLPTCTQPCLATPVMATPACLLLQWVWWVVVSLFTLFLCSHSQSACICVPVPTPASTSLCHLFVLTPSTCTWSCLATPVVAAPACLPLQWVWWVVFTTFNLFLCLCFQSACIHVPVLVSMSLCPCLHPHPCAYTCICLFTVTS